MTFRHWGFKDSKQNHTMLGPFTGSKLICVHSLELIQARNSWTYKGSRQTRLSRIMGTVEATWRLHDT
jgi:hypothetical protein